MALEKNDIAITVVVTAPDGEATAQNSKKANVKKFLLSTFGKFPWWILPMMSWAGEPEINQGNDVEMGRPVERRSPVQTLFSSLRPVRVTVEEYELGKLLFNLGSPLTVGLVITSGENLKTTWGYFLLLGLSLGCLLIYMGLYLRTVLPRAGKVIEHAGITLVITSFYGLVASALPPKFAWALVLSTFICVLPLIIAVLPHNTTPVYNNTVLPL